MSTPSHRRMWRTACTYPRTKSYVRVFVFVKAGGIYLLLSDHEWKHSFFIQCLSPILEATVAVVLPDYDRIVSLDSTVRDFHVPPLLNDHNSNDTNARFLVMQRALVSTARDIGLLILWSRCYSRTHSTVSSNPTAPPSILYGSVKRIGGV